MIINKTKGTVIAKRFNVCKSAFRKFKGLMFSKQKNLVFMFDKKVKHSIHMFFVFYPIDIIFLDENFNVVELKQSLKPWKIYFPKQEYKYFIELNIRAISRSKTQIGDKVMFDI